MARPHNTVCADAFHFCAIRKEPEWLSLAQTGAAKVPYATSSAIFL